VNFDGTGTVSINESGNVSSVTDNGTGSYKVNFATAMSDANYSSVATAPLFSNSRSSVAHNIIPFSSSYIEVRTFFEDRPTGGSFARDLDSVCVAIFR
jgi:hypothetical protein